VAGNIKYYQIPDAGFQIPDNRQAESGIRNLAAAYRKPVTW